MNKLRFQPFLRWFAV